MNDEKPFTTALEQTVKKPITIRQHLESDNFKNQVQRALPRHLTADRFIRIAATTIMRQPLLAECDQASFFNTLLTLSQLGLEPDGRRAHLIPFWNSKRNCYECQHIVDYKGLAELIMRSSIVSYLHADMVCENDDFIYNKGQIEKHIIDFKKPRGKSYAVFSLCRFKDGTEKAEVMSIEDVEAIRKRSRASNSGPWVSDWGEMAKKTVFRRLSKWLPLSPEMRDAVDTGADVLDIPIDIPKQPEAFVPPTPPPAEEPKKRRGRPPQKAKEEPPVPQGEVFTEPAPHDVEPETKPVQERLAEKLVAEGFSFEDLKKWNADMQFLKTDLESCDGFASLPTEDATRLWNAWTGLLRGLKSKH